MWEAAAIATRMIELAVAPGHWERAAVIRADHCMHSTAVSKF